MKKTAIILWIVAALFLICSIPQFIQGNAGAGVCGIVLAAVLGFVGYKKHERIVQGEAAAAEEAQKAAECAAQLAAERAEYDRRHGIVEMSVAGVTFDNDDGTSRQRILSNFFRENGYDAGAEATLQQYEYSGKPAVYVLLEGKIIGSVPKSHAHEIISIIDRIEFAAVNVRRFRSDEGKQIYNADLKVEYAK